MGRGRGVLTSEKQRKNIQDLVETASVAGARKKQACKVLGISVRSLQRWKKSLKDKRGLVKKKPHNKLSVKEREEVLKVVNSSKFGLLPVSKIVPLLADEGHYIASESTMYRILKQEKLLRHRLASKPIKNTKPKALQATRPNKIYSWDITYLSSTVKGVFFFLYLFMDVFSRKIVGWQVYDRECSECSADVIESICLSEGIKKDEVVLHSDNGGPMKGATMLMTLQKLGVMPSFSRPAVSNDNPYSESLFRTVKYCPKYPLRPFSDLNEARDWVEEFVHWYNYDHLHSGIKFVTPAQRHAQQDSEILKNRHEVYLKAKKTNPNRWSRHTRNWNSINTVLLNPEKNKSMPSKMAA